MAAIILAGGKSERMGEDKAWMPYLGRPLIEHILEIVGGLGMTTVVVASEPGQYDLGPSVRVIGDSEPGKGPLAGVISGLSEVDAGVHFVAACDMPFVNSVLISELLKNIADYDAVVPMGNGRLQPLCAAYHTRGLPKLERLLQSNKLSMNGAIEALNAFILPPEVVAAIDGIPSSFTNINTPEDWRLACRETL